MTRLAILAVEVRTALSLPLATATVPCGFPSPAEEHLDKPLDLNELMITNVPATFMVRVTGDSLSDIGILPNDYAIVNRAITAADKAIVVALVDGEFTMKRFRRRGNRHWLQAENPAYPPIEVLDGMTFEVWGVVTGIVRKF